PGVTPRDPGDISEPRIYGNRRADELRSQHSGCLLSDRHLYRPYSQGRETCRAAGGADVEVRAGHQQPDRSHARPHGAADAARHRRRGDRMTRREFIALLGGAAGWPLVASAQQAGKVPTIGFLGTGTPSSHGQWFAAFVQRLRELGWIEGRTVALESRWAEGRDARFAEITAEFVRMKVEVSVTTGAALLSAKRVT